MDFWVFSASVVVGSAIGSLFYPVFHNYSLNNRLSSLESRVEVAKSTYMSARGNASQAQAREREEAAMLEAVTLLKDGQKFEEVVKTVGAKYPDVAMRLMKKLGGL